MESARPVAVQSRVRSRPLVEDLIAAAASHDRARFDALFEVWLAAVFSECAHSMGDRAAAEALTEKLLVRALRNAAE